MATDPHTCVYRTRNVATLAKWTAIAYTKNGPGLRILVVCNSSLFCKRQEDYLVAYVGELEIFAKIGIT